MRKSPIKKPQETYLTAIITDENDRALKCSFCQGDQNGVRMKHDDRKIQKFQKHLTIWNYDHNIINICNDCIAMINKEINND